MAEIKKIHLFNIKTVHLLGSCQLHCMISIFLQDRRTTGSQESIPFSATRLFLYGKAERLRFGNPIQIKL